jgi:hypothetical protein
MISLPIVKLIAFERRELLPLFPRSPNNGPPNP